MEEERRQPAARREEVSTKLPLLTNVSYDKQYDDILIKKVIKNVLREGPRELAVTKGKHTYSYVQALGLWYKIYVVQPLGPNAFDKPFLLFCRQNSWQNAECFNI